MGISIALAGNPNCGKTTLFNDLTGASQYVGNWPGVTVEKKEGKYLKDKETTVTDLPGIYSLSPYSPEEIVSRDYLLEGGPDVVVNLVDATNLERNLYLTTQIIDLGVPVVVALNMMDLVEKNGDAIDIDGLSKKLGVPVMEMSALRGRGTDEVMQKAAELAAAGTLPAPSYRFSNEVEEAIGKVIDVLGNRVKPSTVRWYAIKLLEGEERTVEALGLDAAAMKTVDAVRAELETALDEDAESIITGERYEAITDITGECVKKSAKGMTTTQKIDRVVTNRWAAIPIFIVIMGLVYYVAVSFGGGLATDWGNDAIGGDGWLYTGRAAFDEATADYEDAQAQIEAYVTEVEGADAEGTPSEDAQAVLDALAVAEPEEPEDSSDTEAMTAYEDAVAEYDEAQETIADFDEKAQAEDAVAAYEVEDDEGNVTEEEIDYAAYQDALAVEEPDASDGSWGVWVPGLTTLFSNLMESIGASDWVTSLVVDGIVAGVGAVIGFIPQMILLFLMLSFLEYCGYMARVAFVMDRIFRKFGLSGKSFIPMLIGSGCGVPAVMSTKTIENEKDRRMTIMTTTMIPCGAKMPIIALVFGALAGGDSAETWWVAPLFYFMGVVAIIISGIMLKKLRAFAGEATPFIMELPQYHMPTVKSVLLATWDRVKHYIIKAGTIIFLSSIVIWFLMNFGIYEGAFGLLDSEVDGYLDYSFMAMVGNALAWIFEPLGFGFTQGWQATVTSITGLVAKENVVATVGILTSLGELGETDPTLWEGFANMLGGSTSAIVAFCAFNLLCAPCFAAIGAIRDQMRSAKWTWATIGYMTGFGWCVGLMLRQFVGLALGEIGFSFWTVLAVVVLAGMIFQLVRPVPDYDKIDAEKAAKKGLDTSKNAA